MVTVRRALPLSLVLLLGIAGCANVSGVASTVAGRPLPLPLPPHEVCTYPSSQELLSLAAASDVVVEATVVDAARSGSIGNSYFWTYRISGGRVLGSVRAGRADGAAGGGVGADERRTPAGGGASGGGAGWHKRRKFRNTARRMSERSQTHDTVRDIEFADDFLADQVAQRL